MRENFKIFGSTEDFNNYRATDGWDYPSVNFIEEKQEKSIYYNKEFIMRWYDKDDAKKPYFFGDISHEEFKHWVDTASMPCEIKKDGTEFNYLLLSDFNKTATDHTGLVEKGLSHYKTLDRRDYLQMTEIKQVNVGLFENPKEGWKEVRFNFDPGCPKGFHKWFAHPYWNEGARSFTKLWGRYDVTPVTTTDKAPEEGVNCCYGESQGILIDNIHKKGNWNVYLLYKGIHTVLNKSLFITYWEYLILEYIFSAYYKSFNSFEIFKGINTSYTSGFAGDWINGQTDTINTSHGKLIQNYNEPYRFMYMENPLYGKQWLYCSGVSIIESEKIVKISLNDIESNSVLESDRINFDYIYNNYIPNQDNKFIKNFNLLGLPEKIDEFDRGLGVLVSGNSNTNHIILTGGYSYGQISSRLYSIRSINDEYTTTWVTRGRLTMNR